MLKKHLRNIVLFVLATVLMVLAATPAMATYSDAALRDRKSYLLVPEGEVYEIDFPNMLHTYGPLVDVTLEDGTMVRCREITAYVNGTAYRPVLVPESNISWTYSKKICATRGHFHGSAGDLTSRYAHIQFKFPDSFSTNYVPWGPSWQF